MNRDHLILIKDYCRNNKVQVIDHFKNFDLFNKKKIQYKQFVGVLVDFFGNFKLVKNSDIEEIAEFYRDPEDPLNVNYWNFLNDLELTNQPYNPFVLTHVTP